MDKETRDLLIEADSYLSLLWYRFVPHDKKIHEPVLGFEINDLIGRLRNATKAPAPVSLKAADWFQIRGRGWVASIDNSGDQLPTDVDLSDLLNADVIIDGKKYYVTGVERQGYSRRQFGLLIRGE